MEQTKCWVVIASSPVSLSWGSSNPTAVFLSKQEADFYAWERNKISSSSYSMLASSYFSVREIAVIAREKTGKSWEQFCKEKRIEIDKQIAENTSHSDEDLARVESLKKEKELYLKTN